jgi:hypothetical protein
MVPTLQQGPCNQNKHHGNDGKEQPLQPAHTEFPHPARLNTGKPDRMADHARNKKGNGQRAELPQDFRLA